MVTYDLHAYIRSLSSIETIKEKWRPFDTIVMGRPVLGMPGDLYVYQKNIDAVLKTLGGDAEMARKEGAALVYRGHGNEHWSTGIYAETEKRMREVYPEVATYIGVVEGTPSLTDIRVLSASLPISLVLDVIIYGGMVLTRIPLNRQLP